ncbi:MAG: GtrA family protein [Alphaproteobacteria bacterium]|nr:GtrA family protein [Alphaproteobacteria bacterium]
MMDADTRRQLAKFIAAGVLATLVDFGTYFLLLYTVFDGRYDASKAVAYVLGTTVAYLLAKFWTFPDRTPASGETARFLALYALAAVVNVTVNRGALWVTLGLGLDQQLAELGSVVSATGCSMILNFVGQKFWVFRDAPA